MGTCLCSRAALRSGCGERLAPVAERAAPCAVVAATGAASEVAGERWRVPKAVRLPTFLSMRDVQVEVEVEVAVVPVKEELGRRCQ